MECEPLMFTTFDVTLLNYGRRQLHHRAENEKPLTPAETPRVLVTTDNRTWISSGTVNGSAIQAGLELLMGTRKVKTLLKL